MGYDKQGMWQTINIQLSKVTVYKSIRIQELLEIHTKTWIGLSVEENFEENALTLLMDERSHIYTSRKQNQMSRKRRKY